jgi:hypothetical protein
MRIISLLTLLLLLSINTGASAAKVATDATETSNKFERGEVKQKVYKEERLPFGYVSSMDAMNSGGHPTADSLMLSAEMENRYGHHDKAIWICQKALEMDPNDIDIHKLYAESMEKKLRKQKGKDKDPMLFLASVREWLIVLRGERGEEMGLTNSKGLGIPGMAWMYRDEDRAIPAQEHLIQLVGYPPKATESDQKYLRRVAMATEKVLKGHIMDAKEKAAADKTGIAADSPAPIKVNVQEAANPSPKNKSKKSSQDM